MTEPIIFSVDSNQDHHAGGRVSYAADMAREGAAAIARGEYAEAVKHFLESVDAYPHPTTLRRLGLCLLLDWRPADAVLHLAASVGLSGRSRRTRPTLLLALAFLVVGNESRCARLLRHGTEIFPGVIRDRIAEAFLGEWRKANLPELIDELLRIIPEEFDAPGAKADPPLSCWQLAYIYGQREADSKREFS